MKITEYIKENRIYLDGGLGTLLQAQGLPVGELPERWNLSQPEKIVAADKAYFDAGSNVVCANTFGANPFKFSDEELEEIICAALQNAKQARAQSEGKQEKWIALDIGPTGRMLAPYGDLDFEEAVAAFAQTIKLGVKYGAELIFIETMGDSYETKAALLAAKESCDLPVFVSNAYGEDGKLMTGATPAAMVALLEGMGADAIGVNCSFGPKMLAGVVEEYLKLSSVPVLCKPNAGLPKIENGATVYGLNAEEFAEEVAPLAQKGVRILGGCCGTSPSYIKALVKETEALPVLPIEKKIRTCVSSYTHAVEFGNAPVLIGERINPTGKKAFKEALRAGDIEYILKEGIAQQEKGVHILDVNVGLPEIDEKETLVNAVCRLQEVVDLPLQIDTSNIEAMEAALRRYNGKAMVNSVNGKQESMATVFPLVKKYGGVVVALTLDENGIPENAEGRVEIAKKILAKAREYGIEKKDIVFDPLALTVSADSSAGKETLAAVREIKCGLGCHTSLGVSNVSFGLPKRDIVNAAFFTLALGQGLSAAIMNPYSVEMMKTYYAYRALTGLDENCGEYVAFAQRVALETNIAPVQTAENDVNTLGGAIAKGLKEKAGVLTRELIKNKAALQIVQEEIVPALDLVGAGFERKTVYLPQLLMSAEAAKAAFEVIKENTPCGGATKCAFVLATVKGDIHDIGKNIVKLLLENYGFAVCDLGKDVPKERIVEKTVELHAPLVGLSALMTTTVPAMEETIRALRKQAPWCKVVVGGAVLTQEYADKIGADKYAKDAMETVRFAEEINERL
ncbi:MAG: homocysteine methyltransferase [Clostridiales bacterium]|nr:homocysteine methyltransferase [Clostridiales bacterium]